MHKTNLHTHGLYCDGKNRPEEMVIVNSDAHTADGIVEN